MAAAPQPFSLRLKAALLAPLPIFALSYFAKSTDLFPVLIFVPVIVECFAVLYAFTWLAREGFNCIENIFYTLIAAVPLGVVLFVLLGVYGRVHF